MPQRNSLAPLLSFRSKQEGCCRETPRVHNSTRLHGGMAFVARAQQPPMLVIGFLRSTSIEPLRPFGCGVSPGAERGRICRGPERLDRLPLGRRPVRSLPAELVQHRVDIIVATGGSEPARAAKAATTTIPIVFSGGGDPVREGFLP